MQRPIVGFGADDDGEPIAILSCGHPQHVRHQPPFVNRPWVVTEEGRRSKLGALLNCVRCDRLELPRGFAVYETSPTYSAVPAAHEQSFATKPGIWARIVVAEGSLRQRVEALGVDIALLPERPGIVAPEVPSRLELLGHARFRIEYLRRSEPGV